LGERSFEKELKEKFNKISDRRDSSEGKYLNNSISISFNDGMRNYSQNCPSAYNAYNSYKKYKKIRQSSKMKSKTIRNFEKRENQTKEQFLSINEKNYFDYYFNNDTRIDKYSHDRLDGNDESMNNFCINNLKDLKDYRNSKNKYEKSDNFSLNFWESNSKTFTKSPKEKLVNIYLSEAKYNKKTK